MPISQIIAEATLTAAFAVVVFGPTVIVLAHLSRILQRRERPDDTDESDSGGGGGSRKDPRPKAPGGGGEPAWWPEFERQFAEHLAREPVAAHRELRRVE